MVEDLSNAGIDKLPIQSIGIDLKIDSGEISVIPESPFKMIKSKPELNETLSTVVSPGSKPTVTCIRHFIATTTWRE